MTMYYLGTLCFVGVLFVVLFGRVARLPSSVDFGALAVEELSSRFSPSLLLLFLREDPKHAFQSTREHAHASSQSQEASIDKEHDEVKSEGESYCQRILLCTRSESNNLHLSA